MSTNAHLVQFRCLILLCLLTLLPSSGCSLLRRSAPVVDRSQEARIRGEVQARLAREPTVDASLMRVEVDGNTVLLYGSVRGLAAWKCALRNAVLVEGVTGVVDFLILERGPRDALCLAPDSIGMAASKGRDRNADRD